MGSLFDGIGGFPLAAQRCGIRPMWASEIEPFPVDVTKLRLPGMIHVGDIKDATDLVMQPTRKQSERWFALTIRGAATSM